MSLFSAKTGLSSILKSYSPMERDKAKNLAINKVRFEMPKKKGLLDAVRSAVDFNNYDPMNDYIDFLVQSELTDLEFFRILSDARTILHQLQSPKCTDLVETLLCLQWSRRTPDAVHAYTEFSLDAMVSHSKYIQIGVAKLIALWLPADTDAGLWSNDGLPKVEIKQELDTVHNLLNRILTAIPMAFDAILEAVKSKFPYYKKAPHVVAGYMYNVLRLIEYQPIFTDFVVQLLFQKLIILDVNAPRNEIEETDFDDDEEEDMEDDENEQIFEMEDCNKESTETLPMNHPIAQTLDICMERFFDFLNTKNPTTLDISDGDKVERQIEATKFFKVLLNSFENVILPSHNTHHVQFLIFYYCSFKHTMAESFLNSLWYKIQNPNTSTVVRQSAVGYLASFLARSKFISIYVLKNYLKELCNWAHQYIERCDQYRLNGSLKANLVFFTVCQAIFYVIAFRSRDLTSDKQNLLFLQNLQLSALVTCNFNPLRVCLPAVATAFAGVTRAHQLVYCHAILERNARRKLATVYANDTATAEETLEIFFPFDPYLLKMSGARVIPIYLQYQASPAEAETLAKTNSYELSRKRGDSEMLDEMDDYMIADKRLKLELAKSQERESQFTYGLSPGFHQ